MAAVLTTNSNPLDDRTDSLQDATTPLLATTAITKDAQLFPMPKWAPRQGRNRAHLLWESSLRQLLAAFGLTMDQLEEDAPPLPQQTLHATRNATPTDDGWHSLPGLASPSCTHPAISRLVADTKALAEPSYLSLPL